MKLRLMAIMTIFMCISFFSAKTSFALTTDELLQLKKAGVPEDVILFITEKDYRDVERVLKLKEAGFKDETILSIIKNDLKGKPSTSILKEETKSADSKVSEIEASSKIKILWYLIYRGNPVLQNSQTIDKASVSTINGSGLRFEWKEGGLGLLDVMFKKPFKSPFLWDINKDDTFGEGKEGYAYMLTSTTTHKGKPDTDGSHYWVVYFDTKDMSLVNYLKENLSNK